MVGEPFSFLFISPKLVGQSTLENSENCQRVTYFCEPIFTVYQLLGVHELIVAWDNISQSFNAEKGGDFIQGIDLERNLDMLFFWVSAGGDKDAMYTYQLPDGPASLFYDSHRDTECNGIAVDNAG